MKTSLALVATMLSAALLATWSLWSAQAEEAQVQTMLKVKVALSKVEFQHVPRYYDSIGTLEAVSQVRVSAEVPGRVSALHFDSGQRVEAGQPLISLNDEPQRAQRRRLEAVLRNAEQRLQRMSKLAPSGAASQEQFDQARADRDAARGELAQVNALIAQKNIRAPFSGELGIRQVHLGQYLNPGDVIANLSDSRRLRVNFSLDERARSELDWGQPVELRFHARPDQRFEARINAIDPILDDARMIHVQASLDGRDRHLAAGMFAEVRVRRPDRAKTLSITQTAILATAYGDMVFIAREEDGVLRAKRVAVRTGDVWDGRVEVLEGLQISDRVVVSGQNRLSDETPLQVLPRNSLDDDDGQGPQP
ncbi:efflux RND transporter periplasmic adaptor subunit [Pseudomonas sp.]|uniref:efflux RND transporter periplasmic adaptor subunit n=1 Tax=Pseudomonas sp. TaxID=306 RepID=UPI003A987FF9